jgi:hypothetical protein
MKIPVLITLVSLTYALASCGGGGGSDDNDTNSGGNEPTPPATAVQQLNWIAPSTRTDGSFLDLSELSGYKIYAGPTDNNLELIADVEDAQATSYDLSDIDPGDYYFGVVAYDTNGLQSPISDRIQKTVTE